MKYEEGKRHLSRVRTIDLQIKEKNYLIEALYTCIGLQGISYDKVSVVSSPDSKFERIIGEITEHKAALEKLQLKKAKVIREIMAELTSLGECPERTILVGFYINGMDMERISEDLGYATSWCYKLRRKGIEAL